MATSPDQEELEEETPKMNDREYPLINSIVLWLKIGTIAFAILFVSLAIALVVIKTGFDEQHHRDVMAQQQRDAELLQRRIDACVRDNTVREGERTLATTSAASAQATAKILIGDQQITPKLQAALDEYNATVVQPFLDQGNSVTGKFSERNCTPESILAGG